MTLTRSDALQAPSALMARPAAAATPAALREGRVGVATRMRRAPSQPVVAVAAFNDGSFWQQRMQVLVAPAACVEGG